MSGRHDDEPRETAAELARRLAQNAEAVCREYLGNGQRSGRYWHAGDVANLTALRFLARCYYRASTITPQETRPALLAAITDLEGRITGVHRTWLDASGRDKAHVANPRRALGNQLGHGVRFGRPGTVMLAGEDLETVLSLKTVMPGLPMVAALSASHLGALVLPRGLQRLYIARDRDAAGCWAFERLASAPAMPALLCLLSIPSVAISTTICWNSAPLRSPCRCGSSWRPRTKYS